VAVVSAGQLICKSFTPRSRQITVLALHDWIFTGWMLFLTPNQHHQSTEGGRI